MDLFLQTKSTPKLFQAFALSLVQESLAANQHPIQILAFCNQNFLKLGSLETLISA